MRVSVDSAVCQGHALCNINAPEVYQLDDDGHCLPITEAVPADRHAAARKGADACPERALRIIED